jgi:hypothetical protein
MDPDDASSAEMNQPFTAAGPVPLALDEETVERLLAGDLPPAQAPPGYAEVATLLAATVAEPSPEELAGRPAALAELRAMTRTGPAAATPRRAGRLARRRRVGLAVVVVVGALATGGAAAAATGHLPGPIGAVARSILATVGGAEPATPPQPGRQPAPDSRNPDAGGAATGTQGPWPAGATDPAPGPTAAGPAAGPGVEGLCEAFMAGQGTQQGKEMDATAFRSLADAAGGAGQITAYCQAMQPDNAKPKEQQAPLDDQGEAQGEPLPSTGELDQGPGGPPDTGAHSPQDP